MGATPGVSQAIPFGSIAKASAVRVNNDTTQDIIVKSGGNTVGALAPGGFFAMGGPTATGATGALTAMTFELTATQAEVERVGYWVFGE